MRRVKSLLIAAQCVKFVNMFCVFSTDGKTVWIAASSSTLSLWRSSSTSSSSSSSSAAAAAVWVAGCRAEHQHTAQAESVLQSVTNSRARERISLQPLFDTTSTHRDRAACRTHWTTGQDLVPEQTHEVEERSETQQQHRHQQHQQQHQWTWLAKHAAIICPVIQCVFIKLQCSALELWRYTQYGKKASPKVFWPFS